MCPTGKRSTLKGKCADNRKSYKELFKMRAQTNLENTQGPARERWPSFNPVA